MFGVICAVAAIPFLQLTKVDRESFSFLFTRIGYFVMVVAVVTNVPMLLNTYGYIASRPEN
jgi:hypothetical protein